MKRILDTSAVVLGLLLPAPLLAGVALLIKLTSPGPSLFEQDASVAGFGRFEYSSSARWYKTLRS